MIDQQPFKMFILPDVFKGRVSPGEGLKPLLEDAAAIVSPRDISKIYSINVSDRQTLSMNLMPNTEVVNMFRHVRDGDGRQVYEKAEIKIGTRASPKRAMNIQTFVQADKLIGFSGLVDLIDHFDNPGISKMPASTLTITSGGEKYVAFYIPAVLETIPKERFNVPLAFLRERAREEKTITLPSFNAGDITINLKDVVRRTEDFLVRSDDVVQITRDGAHRSRLIHLAGTTLHAVEIHKSDALPTGVPVRVNDMVVTSRKPEKMEDRYLGFVKDCWLGFKEVGIDG